MKTKVIIQGIAGSYHEIAASEYFHEETLEVRQCSTFREVVATLQREPDALGVMAIENTIAGSLLQNHELIRESGLNIVGEQHLRISHHLVAKSTVKLDEITEVASHPMALLQCSEFLETLPQARIVEKEDTAWSAKWVAENGTETHAAICSEKAARIYGLQVLASDIETNPHNFTRFLVLAGSEVAEKHTAKREKTKASLVFSLPHTIGSLSRILSIFSFYELNLTKLQSFPILGCEWEYRFYVNLDFTDYPRYRKALQAVTPLLKDLSVLGEYAGAS